MVKTCFISTIQTSRDRNNSPPCKPLEVIVSKIWHVNMEDTDISFIICLILYLIFFLEIMFYLKLLKQWMRLSSSFISYYFYQAITYSKL